jgi:hypothetical protein
MRTRAPSTRARTHTLHTHTHTQAAHIRKTRTHEYARTHTQAAPFVILVAAAYSCAVPALSLFFGAECRF